MRSSGARCGDQNEGDAIERRSRCVRWGVARRLSGARHGGGARCGGRLAVVKIRERGGGRVVPGVAAQWRSKGAMCGG
eukprot:134025-Chlamydomonas_euryale.AAC.1